MHELTHLSLFSGVGGLDIAAEAAGFRSVGQCEWADYPHKILEQHWPDVPRWRDIRTLTKEDFLERTGQKTVTILSGGFPCQPFSQAGKRRGFDDDRYLWPEMLRVIEDIRPTWVLGENVAGIVNMALDQVLADLEAQDYTAGAVVIPACAVEAPHRRDRVAIMAHANSIGQLHRPAEIRLLQAWQHARRNFGSSGENVADAGERHRAMAERYKAIGHDWTIEPGVRRVAHGIPDRVDRITCLGNAVVPQQFYPIFEAIARIEAATA